METLATEAKKSEQIVLNGETPGIFEDKFLLREQLIGEVRGLKRAKEFILDKLKELKNSEKPDHENTTDTTDA